ncbi:MAG: histidine kinase dimerization/phospho-acceptor domain-containing protein, partial [Phycisphaerae bacterium]
MTLPSSDGQPSPFPPPAITTTVPPAAAASSELDKPLNTAIAAKVRRPRRHSERHARLTQLAEMGNLAAGLAHELKNPLSTLKLNLQLLQEDLAAMPGTEAAQHRAVGLWKVADRLTQTLEDFLRYAGRLELRLQPTAINTLVQDLVDFLEPQAQAGKIRIHTSLAPENPICLLDPHLAKQALFNLLINAVQAMSGPGTAGEAETAAKPSGDLI